MLRINWICAGVLWDIAMLMPFGGRLFLFFCKYGGARYAFATFEDYKSHCLEGKL